METMTCHVAMWYVAGPGAKSSKVKDTLCKSAYKCCCEHVQDH